MSAFTVPTWPAAHGQAVISARYKVQPEDFVVREWLGFEADAEGDHMLLIVRKRGANTQWVAKQLARFAGCDARDVGFAGMKDRHAITEQAYTVPSRQLTPAQWLNVNGEGFAVIGATRQRRKLKRGAHKGNDFEIVLRDVQGDANALRQRLELIEQQGAPNYFGPQRFGIQGANFQRAYEWLLEGKALRDRYEQGFALSAARSFLFNEVLAARIAQGTWNQLLPGERANLNGSNSVFSVTELDDTLLQRCREFDIHPSGPLWGRGEAMTSGDVAELEKAVIAQHASLAEALEKQGLDHERRALRTWVRNLAWTLDGSTLILRFRLHRGAFATAVLGELLGSSAGEFGESEDA
jgi:tRNA pseudouridine13 synthase